MKSIYLILGDSGAGKSRTIRALTGIRVSSDVDISLIDGTRIRPWIWMRAAQEIEHDTAAIINDIRPYEAETYVLPLRIDAAYECPNAKAYIDALIAEGVRIVAIAVLGREHAGIPYALPTTIPTVFVPNSRNLSANAIASQIRLVFGWQ
jgi:energy-coupling factor transporter ATP-binding protein EcfA2